MNNKQLDYHIPKGWVVAIFIYYGIMIITGVSLICFIMIGKVGSNIPKEEIQLYSFIVAILSGAMLASVRYSQKLYKACIDKRVLYENENKAVYLGNIMYFLLRPLYAIVFSVLFVICLLGGLMFLMNGLEVVLNDHMIYFTAFVSAFIGYSIGGVIDSFEIISKEKLNKMV